MSRVVRTIRTIDVHVGGDVHRIVTDGVAPVPGATVRQQRDFLRDHGDDLRRALLYEPRGGHPSHFVDLVVPATDPEASAGFIIMEYMGYPLFSGSNTMATAIALLDAGRIPATDSEQQIALESPGGLVRVTVGRDSGGAAWAIFRPDDTASVVVPGAVVTVQGRDITYDLVWAGCWYAVVAPRQHGLHLVPEEEAAQGELAFTIMEALRAQPDPRHPVLGEQGPVSLVLFVDDMMTASDGTVSQRISPVVHPRSVSRCPSGTGSTAAVAKLVADGELAEGDVLTTVSSWDTRFEASCYSVDASSGVRVAVKGNGWVIARQEVVFDSTDPLTPFAALLPLLSS
jgi:trans-L-3-hydroxyproline dehydratase